MRARPTLRGLSGSARIVFGARCQRCGRRLYKLERGHSHDEPSAVPRGRGAARAARRRAERPARGVVPAEVYRSDGTVGVFLAVVIGAAALGAFLSAVLA